MRQDQAYSRIPTMRTPPPISRSCCSRPSRPGDPPQSHHGGVPIAATQKVRYKDGGDEDLRERAAEEADELAKDAEHRMPELVDGEVEAVEPAVVARMEDEEPAVHRQQGGQAEASAVGYRASWDWIAASTAARLVAPSHSATTLPCESSTATYGRFHGVGMWNPSGMSASNNAPGCHGLT